MSTLLETCLVAIVVVFCGVFLAFIVAINGGPEERAKDGTSIITIEHDGHKWVVGTIWDNSISIHHHPDCECKL